GNGFAADAGADGPECQFQCSLDGRSVIQTCTGEVVEKCSEELACGEARCQEPCAAAAADQRSDGCEFYFQSPRLLKDYPQGCHAAFIVNTSSQPVDLTFELEGKGLDISKSLYRTNPGDATLRPHTGPLAAGDSVILFVSDILPEMV